MKMSSTEKLIILMLCDIHKKLEIEDSINPDLVERAIQSNNTWGLSWAYSALESESKEDQDPEEVEFVADVLDMYNFIEFSFGQLSEPEKENVRSGVSWLSENPSFPGFYGNTESRYLSIARFLVDELNRWEEFKGRIRNSHMPMADGYRRMLPIYKSIISSGSSLSDQNLIEILEARTSG